MFTPILIDRIAVGIILTCMIIGVWITMQTKADENPFMGLVVGALGGLVLAGFWIGYAWVFTGVWGL